MINKKQLSGQLIFDDSVKRLWAIRRLPGGTKGYPAQSGLIRLSVRPSVHACRLGIQRKMAQAQQIRSINL